MQLKYIDVGELTVATNNRCTAEQIKDDKVENVATVGVQIEEFGKVSKSENPKNVVKDGVEIEECARSGKSDDSKTNEE